MQIKKILRDIIESGRKTTDSILAAEVLMAYALGIGKEKIFMNPERFLTGKEYKRFSNLYERHEKGEPLAYLIGKKEFYGLAFVVNKDVLIPRPETEILVGKALQYAGEFNGRILDVGTGSGCIAITLAKKLGRKVYASDVSEKALKIAKKNAKIHDADVTFFESDLLENINGEYDIIVANLPYIGKKMFTEVDENVVAYEPHEALFSGDDGLDHYRKLFAQVQKNEYKPRILIGEIGYGQGGAIKKELNKFFEQEDMWVEKDLASFDRMFVVRFHR